MDNQFPIAVHLLILIAKSPQPMNSKSLAQSCGTNPSYIRKILTRLKKAGLIESRQGKSGFHLLKEPDALSLKDIYIALYEKETSFPIHKNPNPLCPVGQHITPVMEEIYEDLTVQLLHTLEKKSLDECIQKIGNRLKQEERS